MRSREPLHGARVLHVNATAYGGGVAELLATHVALLRDLGIEAEWQVIQGSDEFFSVTKAVHNALQGADVEWTDQMERTYLEQVLDNALQLEGEWDYVVMHDPQPAAMLDYARSKGVAHASTKWIWRCHIDLTDANPTVWKFFQSFVEQYDASVWTMPEFVPASMPRDRTVFAPPCIDPLSVKNLEMPRPFVEEINRQYGVRPHDPLIVQVSRFDPWKDPVGVIEAFRIVREEFPTRSCVLAGSMATDDPEGFHYWELADEARAGDPDIHLVSNIQQVGAVQINAFQRAADVVMQKSLREGFGLTVSEATVEGPPGRRRPLRRHHHADPRRRERLPRRLRRGGGRPHRSSCSRNPDARRRDGRDRAATTCATTSCRPASSKTGCGSSAIWGNPRHDRRDRHRGARTASRPNGERQSRSHRAERGDGGGVASAALGALVRRRAQRSRRDVDRGRDLRRRPRGRRVGLARRPRRSTSGSLALDPELHAMHYDVVSNSVLWFLFHDLFDRVAPAALRPPLPRGVGRVPHGQRRVRRSDRRRRRAEATSCS